MFFGLIASGKSTLAQAWAEQYNIVYYNSDIVRKELAGLTLTNNGGFAFNQSIYTEDYTRKTYQTLIDKAGAQLCKGKSVVLDASYRSQDDRELVRNLGKKHGALVRFILCSCPENELQIRLEKRLHDPHAVSDGRWEIYLKQKELFEAPVEMKQDELITMVTTARVEDLVTRLEKALGDI